MMMNGTVSTLAYTVLVLFLCIDKLQTNKKYR